MAKFIFVTGGVVSSLGKGIAAAGLGAILGSMNYRVKIRKLDPYLNVDPGTMNPLQHGEVFVTKDGGETDLDLGHYERFTEVFASKNDNITSGKIYKQVIEKERRGDYLGETCTIIPHVTDVIKNFISQNETEFDFIISEVGGTVGDIEGQPFLEAIRQLAREKGRQNCVFLHVTLLPYIAAANEVKTKPTQHSVKELMSYGIEPDIILCRSDGEIPETERVKISLFCNVDKECVIFAPSVKSIYQIPVMYAKNGLGAQVLRKLGMIGTEKLQKWQDFTDKIANLKNEKTICIVGKYIKSQDAYKSLVEALQHAAIKLNTKLNIKWVDAKLLDDEAFELPENAGGILVPGGFGNDGIEGKIKAIKFARENNIPFLGICLGMQLAVIEFARNVCGISNATSSEFNQNGENIVLQMEKWIDQNTAEETRAKMHELGGTMRLGSYDCDILPNTTAYKIYEDTKISERHRHRYEVSSKYIEILETKGAKFSGFSTAMKLPEIFEIQKHKFFIAGQFHPEFNSNPFEPNKIFIKFIDSI